MATLLLRLAAPLQAWGAESLLCAVPQKTGSAFAGVGCGLQI